MAAFKGVLIINYKYLEVFLLKKEYIMTYL